MSLDLYGTWALQGLIRTVKPSLPGFWLNFFQRTFTFETEEVDFDVVMVDRKVAPFVMPTSAGVPQRERGFETRKYKPAYIKVSHALNPRRTLERQPGEGFGGTLSPLHRQALLLGAYAQDHVDMIQRRWNLMAAEVMQFGTCTIGSDAVGSEYPKRVIDFGRDPALNITKAAGSRWGDAGVSILSDIEDTSQLVYDKGFYPVKTVIMGNKAWKAMRQDSELRDLMKLFAGNRNLQLDLAPGSGAMLQYKGSDGSREFWTYNEQYDIDESTSVPLMDPRDVLYIAADGIAGAQAFGAILDVENLMAQAIFTKSWIEENPSSRQLLSQSAPMVIPGRPNCVGRARVVA